MLTELRIEHFAIIQHLALEFGPGLSTFTGETGAGKSILLDAIIALVGGRADPTFIRSGQDRAIIEATFRLPADSAARAEIIQVLEREELLDDPNYLTLGRELRREGRSVARVNGRTVSLSLLRELGSYLVDIHGQSDHLSLLDVRAHLGLLDRYANNEKRLEEYRKTYRELGALRRELNSLRQGESDSARRAEMLVFQAEEIESAHLRPGEEDELRKERDRLANAENLAALARQCLTLLDEGNPESPAISELVGQVVQSLAAIRRIDPAQARLHQQLELMADTLSEVARDLARYLEQLEFNPRRLEQVEERLNLIQSLKRKYGGSIESAIAFAQDARRQLETIAHASERISELEEKEAHLLRELTRRAGELSQQRRKAAEALSQAVERELADLSMEGAQFTVSILHEPDSQGLPLEADQTLAYDENGVDRVEFLIAPNPGEGFKPLVKTASGGETSRLMLALKNVLARADAIPTLIFDEVDQGIGGRVGAVVGEKLWQLARQHQVLCVTHLPQLAAFSDQHFHVQKVLDGERTLTQVWQLEEADRLAELAQMLGRNSQANRNAAQETLVHARKRMAQFAAK